HFGATWKGVEQHLVPELLKHSTNLALRHYVAVEFVGSVGEVLIEQLQPLCSREPVPHVHIDARRTSFDGCTLFGDPRSDAVHVEIDVYTVGNCLVVPVLHDEVLLEEANSPARGRGGEADEKCIEVQEHLTPQLIDGAVTLVHDDEVE